MSAWGGHRSMQRARAAARRHIPPRVHSEARLLLAAGKAASSRPSAAGKGMLPRDDRIFSSAASEARTRRASEEFGQNYIHCSVLAQKGERGTIKKHRVALLTHSSPKHDDATMGSNHSKYRTERLLVHGRLLVAS